MPRLGTLDGFQRLADSPSAMGAECRERREHGVHGVHGVRGGRESTEAEYVRALGST